jgi:hypothetical protein
MLFWQDAYAHIKPFVKQGIRRKYLRYTPYIIGLIILIAFVFASRPFWLTNDDVSMAMISRGTGIAAWPSPRLVLTNIAWGYLVQWLPDVGGIQSYTLMTYGALAFSYLAVLYAFIRSDVHKLFGAAILLVIYAPTLVYPQYTLVAGYLAFAGIALVCIPPDRQSILSLCLAGVLVVLSGLVRADETLLVIITVIPMCIGYWRAATTSSMRRRWLIMMVSTAAIFAAFQLIDLWTFASGQWGEFAKTYVPRTEFTDFNLGSYYEKYRQSLQGAGLSILDLQVLEDWFYIDPKVFSVDTLAHLSEGAQWMSRASLNFGMFWSALTPFSDPQIAALIAIIVLIGAAHKRGTYFAVSLAVLAATMFALLLAGRPGVTRIYIPVCAALAVVGVMQPVDKRQGDYKFIVMVAVISALLMLVVVRHRNDEDIAASSKLEAMTCRLSREPLVVIWGASYPYTLQYLPFDTTDKLCPLRIYAIGEYSLAPFARDQLYRYTGGKDLVPALLAGQSFDVVGGVREMELLRAYFWQHYSVQLSAETIMQNRLIRMFAVGQQPVTVTASIVTPHRP